METLEDIIEAFPEFLTDEPVNGGDLVEFIGAMIHNYEANRPNATNEVTTDEGTEGQDRDNYSDEQDRDSYEVTT